MSDGPRALVDWLPELILRSPEGTTKDYLKRNMSQETPKQEKQEDREAVTEALNELVIVFASYKEEVEAAKDWLNKEQNSAAAKQRIESLGDLHVAQDLIKEILGSL